MSFWDTFVTVWQVRTSVRIQESIEDAARSAKRQAELESNLPQIVEEVEKKNKSWQEQLENQRSKISQ
jgi:hypothetical protein